MVAVEGDVEAEEEASKWPESPSEEDVESLKKIENECNLLVKFCRKLVFYK